MSGQGSSGDGKQERGKQVGMEMVLGHPVGGWSMTEDRYGGNKITQRPIVTVTKFNIQHVSD